MASGLFLSLLLGCLSRLVGYLQLLQADMAWSQKLPYQFGKSTFSLTRSGLPSLPLCPGHERHCNWQA